MAETEASSRATVYGLLLGILLLIATRWPIRSELLLNFDAANFALAIEDFNPALHQPQPPGYPLFVALLRIFGIFNGEPEVLLPAAGIFGSIVAVFFLGALGDSMFGRPVGICAAALMVVHPTFWYAAVAYPVRVYLAAGSAAVAFTCWKAVRKPDRPYLFLAPGVALGLASGFRPELLLFLGPLVAATGLVASRNKGRRLLSDVAVTSAVAFLWILPVVTKMGGAGALLTAFVDYLGPRSEESVFWGGDLGSMGDQIRNAATWTLLPAASWLWAIALVRPDRASAQWFKWAFLGIWLVPSMSFHALIHVHHPDQTLAAAPILCLAGGWLLSRPFRWGPGRMALAGLLLVAMYINVRLFLYPLSIAPRSTGYYRSVRWNERVVSSTMDALEKATRSGGIVAITAEGLVSRRQLSYYLPDLLVVALPTDVRDATVQNGNVLFVRHGTVERTSPASQTILLPSDRPAIWIAPWDPEVQEIVSRAPAATEIKEGVWRSSCNPGLAFSVGAYRFECE